MKTARHGSAMSTKQLARTVTEGRQVTFRFHSDDPIAGYLCGMDDYHWMVVTPLGTKHLIHKASAPIIDLADEATYNSEPRRSELERIVGPFRRFVQSTGVPASDERAALS